LKIDQRQVVFVGNVVADAEAHGKAESGKGKADKGENRFAAHDVPLSAFRIPL
jgi:hypothetical protein